MAVLASLACSSRGMRFFKPRPQMRYGSRRNAYSSRGMLSRRIIHHIGSSYAAASCYRLFLIRR